MDTKKGAKSSGSVLVVGGGIGGIQTSLDLVEAGFHVYMVEKSPAIGGVMAQLDKTFPTNDCSMCILSPKLVACGRNQNIDIIPNAEISKITGRPGEFKATVKVHPRFVDRTLCTGCGTCMTYCPIERESAFNESLVNRKAIYIEFPQAIPLVATIDREACIGCQMCENVCLAKAVKYDDTETEKTIDVGSVILCPGFDEFDPRLKQEYGYGRFPNVISSIQYERILNASGPYQGHVLRPSDGKVPKRIAWIQCVGSRDPKINKPYCSGVCCMYATKEAIMTREHVPDIESTIFIMDMRAVGKGFEQYYNRAKGEWGIRYVRNRIAEVMEDPTTHDIIIRYESEDGSEKTEVFDLCVLSVGLQISESVKTLADNLGIDLTQDGFAKTDYTNPLQTSRQGIYVAGVFEGPKDIPETVAQAIGAAAKAGADCAEGRRTALVEKEYPKEKDVTGEEPRIGVFVCHCGINIANTVDVVDVMNYAKNLPNVIIAEHNLYTCSQDTQSLISKMIKENNLNRVVIASCTPRTHEPLFQETLRETGLNPYLVEMANIREHCSWIHQQSPAEATQKAKDLVRIAIAKTRMLQPLKRASLPVTQSALVIGGGAAGLNAALDIAKNGFPVTVIEREDKLGGNLNHSYYTNEVGDMQAYLKSLIFEVERNKNITILKNTVLSDLSGSVGNFVPVVKSSKTNETKELSVGSIIVATGANQHKPKEFLYGKNPKVITQIELEEKLIKKELSKDIKSVVMIQCVGSRNDEHPYCSRICCSTAMANANLIKEDLPKTEVYVLYRDVRTYGFREHYYNKAREKGVIFSRWDPENQPEVIEKDGKLIVRTHDPVLHGWLEIPADLVVLSAGVEANPDNKVLSTFLKVPTNDEGFFLEAHVKLRPVDFATEGIFLAGMAYHPRMLDESIAQASAASARALTIISKDRLMAEAAIATVNPDICDGCRICIPMCPYQALSLEILDKETERGRVKVDEALCKGCGACAGACPSGAMEQYGFTTKQLVNMIDAALEEVAQ
ncbi:MAG: CoB--CoM heterodisulfide reductase iron-sulfur subunit A family protein [Caldisericia bacterium]|nr:CoB--CoM heterodisulfide reductase iron-sulfur subunit A family protein [Caldisericia bacterium]